jgi:hypothetical protein
VPDKDYWADCCWEDNVGVVGPRCAPVRGRTAKAYQGSRRIIGRDESPHGRHGTYGTIAGNDGASFLNHGVGGPELRFPGDALGAPGLHGFRNRHNTSRFQWRVPADSPAVCDPGIRPDGLSHSYQFSNGSCQTATSQVGLAPDFGILLRLFLPRQYDNNVRYGVFGFRSGLHTPQPLVSASGLRMVMQGRRLFLEGRRGFRLGSPTCSGGWSIPGNFGREEVHTALNASMGLVPVDEVYTLRLWTKGITKFGNGYTQYRSNHGLDRSGTTESALYRALCQYVPRFDLGVCSVEPPGD